MSITGAGKTVADSLYAYRFIRLMQKDFKDWKAYEFGIINDRGSVLKRPKTDEEKSAYTPFHASVRAFKRMVGTVPGALTLGTAMSSWSAIASRFGMTESDVSLIARELDEPLYEEMVTGDSGGVPDKIAAGVKSGAIVSAGPQTVKPKRKQKWED